jgi:hypothetical protein
MQFVNWDYKQIIRELCIIREKPIDDHVKAEVADELRKLEMYGWPVICEVAESIMIHGRYALNNSLWLIVRNAVRDKLSEIKNQKNTSPILPKYQQIGKSLLSLQNDIYAEISVWLKCTPPLIFNGSIVVKREHSYQPEFFDLDEWNEIGRPELANILLDKYFSIYYDAMLREETLQSDGIIEKDLEPFLNLLKSLRVAQVKQRTIVHS